MPGPGPAVGRAAQGPLSRPPDLSRSTTRWPYGPSLAQSSCARLSAETTASKNILFTEGPKNICMQFLSIYQKIPQFIQPSEICFDDSLYISVIIFF